MNSEFMIEYLQIQGLKKPVTAKNSYQENSDEIRTDIVTRAIPAVNHEACDCMGGDRPLL